MYCAKCDLDQQTGAFCKSCGSFLDPSAKKSDATPEAAPSAKPEHASALTEAVPTPPQTPDATPEATPEAPPATAEPAEPAPTSPEASPDPPKPAEEPMLPAGEPVDPVQPTPAAPAGPTEPAAPAVPATPAATPAPQYPEAQSQQEVSFVSFLKRLWDFKGVSTRRQFITYLLFTIFLAFVLVLLFQAQLIPDPFWLLLHFVLSAVFLLVTASMLTRRLRDTGFSVWWLLLLLIPIAGAVPLLLFLCFPTKTRFTKPSLGVEILEITATFLLGLAAIFLMSPALLTFAVSV